jgi:hypothetical protein
MEHVVKVWSECTIVRTHQKSPSVWIAVGEYMGEEHESKGRSEMTAVARWREWATYKGN